MNDKENTNNNIYNKNEEVNKELKNSKNNGNDTENKKDMILELHIAN